MAGRRAILFLTVAAAMLSAGSLGPGTVPSVLPADVPSTDPTCNDVVNQDLAAWQDHPTVPQLMDGLARWEAVCHINEYAAMQAGTPQAAATVPAGGCLPSPDVKVPTFSMYQLPTLFEWEVSPPVSFEWEAWNGTTDSPRVCQDLPVKQLCDGTGSTIIGWRWGTIVNNHPLNVVPDVLTTGKWLVVDFGGGPRGLAVETQGILGGTGPESVHFGPLVLPSTNVVDAGCSELFGQKIVSLSGIFDVHGDLTLPGGPTIDITGHGLLCTVPC